MERREVQVKRRGWPRWHIPVGRGVIGGIGQWQLGCGRLLAERDAIPRPPVIDENTCQVCIRHQAGQ